MRRLQRQRTKGWRMPEGAIYVGRPTLWGNPFPTDGPWLAVAMGRSADAAGRRDAAVAAHRSWITGAPFSIPIASPDTAELEYTDGSVRKVADMVAAMGRMMLLKSPIRVPALPDLAPLRGHDLVCWCPLEDEQGNRVPCHADVLLELAR